MPGCVPSSCFTLASLFSAPRNGFLPRTFKVKSMKNAVEFNDVWKKFKKGEKFNSLRDAIPNFMRHGRNMDLQLAKQEFWAVKNVTLAIGHGEVVGIMGPNGAGKSTILKLLSGIMGPTKGEMTINGRLSAL